MNSFANHFGNEVIPAIPWGGEARPDANERDRQVLTNNCRLLRERNAHFAFENGELQVHIHDGLLSRDNFNKTLAWCRQQGKVEAIYVYVLNDQGDGEETPTFA